MIYVILLLSLIGSYLNGGENGGEGSQSRQRKSPIYVIEKLQEGNGTPENPIDWLARILFSGKSDCHQELQVVPNIKTMESTLWLIIDDKDNPDEKKQHVNLSALLQQEGSLKSCLDERLDQDGYIFKTFLQRMSLAKLHVAFMEIVEECVIDSDQNYDGEQFKKENAQKGLDIVNDFATKTGREYIYLEHEILSAEYAKRSDDYKNEHRYLILNMALSSLGCGVLGGISGAICAKLTGRSYAASVGAGVLLGSCIGAGKELNNGYEQLKQKRQQVERIELAYNNCRLFKEEIARRAPSIRDEAINWGRKAMPFDPRVITSGNPV